MVYWKQDINCCKINQPLSLIGQAICQLIIQYSIFFIKNYKYYIFYYFIQKDNFDEAKKILESVWKMVKEDKIKDCEKTEVFLNKKIFEI